MGTRGGGTELGAIIFPLDSFGSAGCGAGAQLLADVLREMIDDARAEPRPVRTHAFAERLSVTELEFPTSTEIARWRPVGREAVKVALAEFGHTLWVAGNHLGVLPVYDELGKDDLVIVCDAHLDCYDLADTTTELSHGNFLRSVKKPRPTIVNVGSRDLFLVPKDTKPHLDRVFPAEADWATTLAEITALAAGAKRVWLDLDADALDPAFAPGVLGPQPMGLSPAQVWHLIAAVGPARLTGLSVSEFCPAADERDRTLGLLAWLLERLLLAWGEQG